MNGAYAIAINAHGRSCWSWQVTKPDGDVVGSCSSTRNGAMVSAMKLVPLGAAYTVTSKGQSDTTT